MKYTKKHVKAIMKANGLVIRAIYNESMTPDDFTDDEIVKGVLDEVNNPQIEKELDNE